MKRNTNSNKTTRVQQNTLFWIIIVAVVIAITVGIISLGYMQSSGNTTTTTMDWTASGPFSINKQDFLRGLASFIIVNMKSHNFFCFKT